jgi:hypothetical protein
MLAHPPPTSYPRKGAHEKHWCQGDAWIVLSALAKPKKNTLNVSQAPISVPRGEYDDFDSIDFTSNSLVLFRLIASPAS